MDIDITTTAIVRPKIFERTLESFFKNLLLPPHTYSLKLNIDFKGERYNPDIMWSLAMKYFGKKVHFNITETPNFAKAVKWCWSKTSAEYVLHLEDDWVCNIPLSLDNMIKTMERHPELKCLRLSKFVMANFNKKYLKNIEGNIIRRNKISFNPSLFRGDWLRSVCDEIKDDVDPELRLQRLINKNIIKDFKSAYYIERDIFDRKYVVDIGREWKQNEKSNFNSISC